MDRPGSAPESWPSQKSPANRPLPRRFSDHRGHHLRLGSLSSWTRYLRIEGSTPMGSLTIHTSHRNFCRPHRRSLIPGGDSRPVSPDDSHHTSRDLCFRTFLDRSFFEPGERTDCRCPLVFRFRTAASRLLEVFGSSVGPGWLHHHWHPRVNTRPRNHPHMFPLARNGHSFRIDFW